MTRQKKQIKQSSRIVQPQQVSAKPFVSPPTTKPVQNVLRSDVVKPPLEKKQTAAQKNPSSKSENLNQKRSLQIKVSDYVVFDIETTGLKPDSDEIIELSAIRIRNNSVVGEFSQLVKPTHPVISLITDITGITNKMLKDAPRISEVLPLFLRFVGDDIVIGHNVVKFDRKFIENACSMFRFPAFNNDAIDTLCISRNCNLNTQNNKLTTLTEYFGINHKNAHRALSDCYATYELYEILKDFGFQVSESVKFPNTLESQEHLYKEYTFIKILVMNKSKPNYSALHLYDDLRFVQETNSDFDERAVAVYDGRIKLGYLSRGISQDMTNDFIDQGNTILAKLTYIDSTKNELKMDIAYYRNPLRHKYSTSIQETTKDEILAPQYLKQIEESIDIINNTADPKTFLNVISLQLIDYRNSAKWKAKFHLLDNFPQSLSV